MTMLKRILVGVGLAAAAFGVFRIISRRSAAWGFDPVEQTRALPGDDIVPDGANLITRGITIEASPEAVWPWLVQMGFGRAGWYSYDRLDMKGASADAIVPELQDLHVGDTLPTHDGGGFEVRVLEQDHALVLYLDTAQVDSWKQQAEDAAKSASDGVSKVASDVASDVADGASDVASEVGSVRIRDIGPEAGSKVGSKANSISLTETPGLAASSGFLGAASPRDFKVSWAFVLEPAGPGRTRLIERTRGWFGKGNPATRGLMPLLGFGVLAMERRQMLGIRERVERSLHGDEVAVPMATSTDQGVSEVPITA